MSPLPRFGARGVARSGVAGAGEAVEDEVGAAAGGGSGFGEGVGEGEGVGLRIVLGPICTPSRMSTGPCGAAVDVGLGVGVGNLKPPGED